MAPKSADLNNKDIKIVDQDEENNLKYLNFVQTGTLQLVGCLSTAYDYAKDNSGPLKPGVQSLEGTVKTVVSPVYDKYHTVPFDLLKFVDRKVDVSVTEGKRHVPTIVSKAVSAAQKAPEVARSVVTEVRRDGLVGTAKGVAKKVEPVAVTVWHKVNSLPVVPRVTEVVVAYLPLVPTKKIAEIFGREKTHSVTNLSVEE